MVQTVHIQTLSYLSTNLLISERLGLENITSIHRIEQFYRPQKMGVFHVS